MLNHYHFAKYVLIFCLFLSSCAPGQRINNLVTPIISPTVETPAVTSTVPLDSQKLKEIVFSPCLPITPEPLGGNQIPWDLLALRGIIPYAIDPNTGIMTDQLVSTSNGQRPLATDFYSSPDGKWLAYRLYYDEDNVSLVVEPSSNILTNSSDERIVWRASQPIGLVGWLNSESIILIAYRDSNKFSSTLIRNPFNGQQAEFFLEDMPNYLDYQPGMSGRYLFAHSNLMPDPTLTRVVYPAIDNSNFIAALWDVENKKALTDLRLYFDNFFNDPLWSLDGKDFIIMGINDQKQVEWFQVTRDGTIQELTYFGKVLKDAKFEKPSRSWDGRYLSFQLIYNAGKNVKYLVLDLKSQSLDGFCIDSVIEEFGPLQPPVWSPDSRYVAITNGVNTENSGDVILVDVETREAFHIGHDVYARGWIVKP